MPIFATRPKLSIELLSRTGLPPSSAGIFGYLGYDTVRLIEELPDEPADSLGLPDTVLVRPLIVVVFDSVSDELTIVSPARPESGINARQAYDRATDRLTEIVEALDRPLDHTAETDDVDLDAEVLSNTTPADYMAMVEKAKDYIAGELGLLGVPAFMFHEGADPIAMRGFQQIAKLTNGAYCRFDTASAGQLKELLSAVAVYAAGGRKALEDYSRRAGAVVRQITSQVK